MVSFGAKVGAKGKKVGSKERNVGSGQATVVRLSEQAVAMPRLSSDSHTLMQVNNEMAGWCCC